jgi:peptide deformylase
MTIRPLLRYPDPGLRRPASPVISFDPALENLATDLLDTLRAAAGLGVTAPHIGVFLRLVALDLPTERGHEFYVNPSVIAASSALVRHEEGSLSMPGVVAEVERPARVSVSFQTLQGEAKTLEADGLRAVCLQHEIDQIDGVFWIDRLSRLKRERAVQRFKKLNRNERLAT